MITLGELQGEQCVAEHQPAPAVSIVIPAYNEEGAIAEDLAALKEELKASGLDFEIVVVNDGSKDNTAAEAAKVDGIQLINHEVNRGYGAALKTGIRHARADIVVITDADGTYPPRYIPELVQDVRDGADMAVGARVGSSVAIPTIRKPAKWLLAKLASYLAEQHIPDLNSGLRAFRRDAVMRFFNILPNGFSFTTTITLGMLTNGFRVVYRPIDYLHRVGTSKIRPIKDTYNFVVLILRTVCYFNPLRVFVPPAVFCTIVGLVKLIHGVFWEHDISQGEMMMLLAAAQLLGTGMVAEMVSKIITCGTPSK